MRPIAVSVDVHTHGGRTGITSNAPPSGDIARDMRAGSLAAACLADVPDGPILGRNAEGALAVVATKSLLLSHTAVLGSRAMGATPLTGRQITADHERMIAETGGAVGIWNFFATLDRYVEGLKEMADIVGVDHVSISTDQHVTRAAYRIIRNGCTSSPRCCAAASRPTRQEKSPAAITCAFFAPPSASAP